MRHNADQHETAVLRGLPRHRVTSGHPAAPAMNSRRRISHLLLQIDCLPRSKSHVNGPPRTLPTRTTNAPSPLPNPAGSDTPVHYQTPVRGSTKQKHPLILLQIRALENPPSSQNNLLVSLTSTTAIRFANCHLRSRAPGPPSFASMKMTPASSRVRCIASRVLAFTVPPRSKCATDPGDTSATRARCFMVQPRASRARKH
jgi:hypothetical protein